MKSPLLVLVTLAIVGVAAPVAAQPQPECVTVKGQATCGYGCLTAYGQTKCAEHPGASCTSSYGQIACGFSCVAANGELRCAKTPGGVCRTHAGRIVCFEPASGGLPPGTSVPEASCTVVAGVMTCGYHCASANGVAKCAATPAGACGTANGVVTCNDPPAHLAFFPQTPRMQCERAAGQVACGYSCRTANGAVRCAQTPAGICEVNAGTITCFDPPSR